MIPDVLNARVPGAIVAAAAEKGPGIVVSGWHWSVLLAVLAALLLVDILVIHRKAHVVHTREALVESTVWISIGLLFTLYIARYFGGAAAGEYIGGYLIEKSLSIDNVFVWSVLFAHFRVPAQYQHRVLFWGIFGALAMRLGFIFAGVAIIERFDSALIVFGLFLLYSGIKLFSTHDEGFDPETSTTMRIVRRFIPSTETLDGQKMLTRVNGHLLATPLFAVLVLVEITDVVFAVDSVPAVLAVTRSQYIAFASNAFAILGLRALYFLFADMRDRFVHLQTGLGAVLAFVGVKMMLSKWFHMPVGISLGVIVTVLAVSILASVRTEADPG